MVVGRVNADVEGTSAGLCRADASDRLLLETFKTGKSRGCQSLDHGLSCGRNESWRSEERRGPHTLRLLPGRADNEISIRTNSVSVIEPPYH